MCEGVSKSRKEKVGLDWRREFDEFWERFKSKNLQANFLEMELYCLFEEHHKKMIEDLRYIVEGLEEFYKLNKLDISLPEEMSGAEYYIKQAVERYYAKR